MFVRVFFAVCFRKCISGDLFHSVNRIWNDKKCSYTGMCVVRIIFIDILLCVRCAIRFHANIYLFMFANPFSVSFAALIAVLCNGLV